MNVKIDTLLNAIYEVAPLSWQESYDNSGLIIGDGSTEIDKVLLCIDVTEAVVDEAITNKCGLIISHHPIIFKGLKRLVPQNFVERIVIKAIKNNIAIAAIHTNIDNSLEGVNKKIAEHFHLNDLKVIQPLPGLLKKLVCFCPESHSNAVREAMFEAGAGSIGNYDSCSFNSNGTGTFRANDKANPFVGNVGTLHTEPEHRIETIVPAHRANSVVQAMLKTHPYEEVAFDIYPIENQFDGAGAGIIGMLKEPISERELLVKASEVFQIPTVRHSAFTGKPIQKIAICGGSGAFLISQTKKLRADAFITGDMKYHDFFEADKSVFLLDAGHYETEQFTRELIAEIITKKIPNFAVQFSEVNTNAVEYFFKPKL